MLLHHCVIRHLDFPALEAALCIILTIEGQVGTIYGDVKGAVLVKPGAEALQKHEHKNIKHPTKEFC